MSARDQLAMAGIPSGVWIDGSYIQVGPKVWDLQLTNREAVFQAMNLTQTVTAAYDGDGLPNKLDSFAFTFPFDLNANTPQLTVALKTLRTAGGVHTLAVQAVEIYSYRLRAGQATFWMRGDAAAQGFVGLDSEDLAADILIPTSAVPHPTTVYQTLVDEDDTVPANEVWISREMTEHSTSGKYWAFCKLGTAPSAPAAMTAVMLPLFRVVVVAVPRQYPNAGVEEATLMLAETN